MQQNDIIQAFAELGQSMKAAPNLQAEMILRATYENPWFTQDTIGQSLDAIANYYLNTDILNTWAAKYPFTKSPKKVALILAGNIPLVGFHDIMCTLVSGHHLQVKMSDKDKVLTSWVLDELVALNPLFNQRINVVDRLHNFDAVIATGSNNSSSYFKKYFASYPHIIRQNRNSVAILYGDESPEELAALGKDVFGYYGLGCRNVSQVFIPKTYKIETLLEALHSYNEVIYHNKYKNNFDYNIALYMLNKVSYLNNGSIIMLESDEIASRIATLHYSYYDDVSSLLTVLDQKIDQIQCIISREKLDWHFAYGQAQCPAIDDYADHIDTMAFLSKL